MALWPYCGLRGALCAETGSHVQAGTQVTHRPPERRSLGSHLRRQGVAPRPHRGRLHAHQNQAALCPG
jgi:hypothetical protein